MGPFPCIFFFSFFFFFQMFRSFRKFASWSFIGWFSCFSFVLFVRLFVAFLYHVNSLLECEVSFLLWTCRFIYLFIYLQLPKGHFWVFLVPMDCEQTLIEHWHSSMKISGFTSCSCSTQRTHREIKYFPCFFRTRLENKGSNILMMDQ